MTDIQKKYCTFAENTRTLLLLEKMLNLIKSFHTFLYETRN